MDNSSNKRQSFPGPKDRSLEAYKIWFMEVVKRLTKPGTEIKLTEDEWLASWKEYWDEESNRSF